MEGALFAGIESEWLFAYQAMQPSLTKFVKLCPFYSEKFASLSLSNPVIVKGLQDLLHKLFAKTLM
jgi:hypothetical protein